MLNRLGSPEGLLGTSISAYERGVREPPLLVLLKYARIAEICVDALIDDAIDLPEKLSVQLKHERLGGVSSSKLALKIPSKPINKSKSRQK
jgi:hypothetical protein